MRSRSCGKGRSVNMTWLQLRVFKFTHREAQWVMVFGLRSDGAEWYIKDRWDCDFTESISAGGRIRNRIDECLSDIECSVSHSTAEEFSEDFERFRRQVDGTEVAVPSVA